MIFGVELSNVLFKAGEHLFISFCAFILAIAFAVPLGVILTRNKKIAGPVIGLANIMQTIPSLALLAFMIPFLGVGKFPAIIAMFLYSVLPILRNVYIGIDKVDENIIDAAKGMGMNDMQLITKVELPLAMPVIMSGIRLSAVYVIAWSTVASYIGAGGLGDLIFNGLNLYKVNLILAGTIPVTILAVLADLLLGKLEDKVSPRTVQRRESNEGV
ncbi:MAG: ABC transporter permease [Andreesenia angusta]|nr:ABC transporter permease [Andreesenia angusta]